MLSPCVTRRLLRWLNKAATRPELFTDDERQAIAKLVMELASSNDPSVFLAAARVIIRMEGHNQRSEHREDRARIRVESVR